MIFKNRKRRDTASRADDDAPAYDEAARKRLRSVGESGGYAYSENERGDVEAQLRRMSHGAKVEGSKAQPPPEDEASMDN